MATPPSPRHSSSAERAAGAPSRSIETTSAMPSQYDPLDPGQVPAPLDPGEPGLGQHRLHLIRLGGTDLEHDRLGLDRGEAGEKVADRVEPIAAREKRLARLPLGDLGLQGGPLALGHIW